MTLDTLFLLVVTTYLVLIAYGVVGARRRGLAGPTRRLSAALMILLPPLLLAALLWAEGEGAVVAAWWRLLGAMAVAGAMVAFVAERVAARVAP